MVFGRETTGSWAAFSAIGLVAVAIIAVGYRLLEANRPQFPQDHREDKIELTYYPGGYSCNPSIIGPFPSGESTSDTVACQERREQHRLQINDLLQQRRAANAASASAYFSYFQTVIGLGGISFGFLTLCAAIAAAKYARDAANASNKAVLVATTALQKEHRPWLKIAILGKNELVQYNSLNNSIKVPVNIFIKNHGSTPEYFKMYTHYCSLPKRSVSLRNTAESLIEWADNVVFPGEEIELYIQNVDKTNAPSEIFFDNYSGFVMYIVEYCGVDGGIVYPTTRTVRWQCTNVLIEQGDTNGWSANFTLQTMSGPGTSVAK